MKLKHLQRTFAMAVSVTAALPALAEPLGTGFTYQGQLKDGGTPASGPHDFRFRLFDASDTQVGSTVFAPGVEVSDGLFSVGLDFGSSTFSGDAVWLEIDVRVTGAGDPYTTLSPRQPLTAAPYALYALDGPGGAGGFWEASGAHIYNTNSGNVGMGTSNPIARLDVTTDTTSSENNTARFSAPRIGSRTSHIHYGATGDWYVRSADPAGNVLLQDNGGNVGIGTSSPAAKLEVVGDVAQFGLRVISPDIAVYATHDSATGSSPGVYGVTASQSEGAHGVRGLVATSDAAYNAAGVHGTCTSSTAGMGVSGIGFWGVYGEAKSRSGYGGVFMCSDGLFGTEQALLVAGDAEVSDSLLVGNALVDAAAKLQVVNGTDTEPEGGGYIVSGDVAGANVSIDNNEIMARNNGQASTLYLNNDGGDVRIGRGGTGATVFVPVLAITGADLAEKFPISDESDTPEPGTVMEIDPDSTGMLRVSRGAYNRRVAGVVSGAGDIPLGAVLGNLPGHEDAPPIALSGRVWVRCNASTHAIEVGDLLTTSDTPGHAMKAADHSRAQGAIIGKAMSGLSDGRGLVLVLVSLQ